MDSNYAGSDDDRAARCCILAHEMNSELDAVDNSSV